VIAVVLAVSIYVSVKRTAPEHEPVSVGSGPPSLGGDDPPAEATPAARSGGSNPEPPATP
jgi:hypothetical protein